MFLIEAPIRFILSLGERSEVLRRGSVRPLLESRVSLVTARNNMLHTTAQSTMHSWPLRAPMTHLLKRSCSLRLQGYITEAICWLLERVGEGGD